MQSNNYKYDFRSLKSKVGVDDIAASIGYVVNRRAGLGRYIEMMLPDGKGGKSDCIIISRPSIVLSDRGDKSQQRYFRRDGNRPGDVISFIEENAAHFGITHDNKWETIGEILSKYANEPAIGRWKGERLARNHERLPFNPDNYTTKSVKNLSESLSKEEDNALSLIHSRGIRQETIDTFASHIELIKDKRTKYDGFNIGFPYTQPGNDKAEGYEIRGYGSFKRKATGTNSTTAAWIATTKPIAAPEMVDYVFFAESAYDAMAFYQLNKQRIDSLDKADDVSNCVFVSIGGTFSNSQVKGIADYYPNATVVDCFDNDLPGRIYGMRLISVIEDLDLTFIHKEDGIHVNYNDQDYVFDAETAGLNDLKGIVRPKRTFMERKPPTGFKDWNDVAMKNPLKEDEARKTKYDRNESLRQKRSKGIKM